MGNLFEMLSDLFDGFGERRDDEERSRRGDDVHHRHDGIDEDVHDRNERRPHRERGFDFFGD